MKRKKYPRKVAVKDNTEWEGRREPLAAMAEAAVAAVLWADDPHTLWNGGHNQAVDVTGNGVTVDAKVAFIEPRRTRGKKQLCLAFMGSLREHKGGKEVRDGVDYYALAVPLAESATVHVGKDLAVSVKPVQFTIYLVPAADVAQVFLRAERMRDGVIGKGMVRCCPVGDAERYRVAGPTVPSLCAGVSPAWCSPNGVGN